MPIEIHGKNVEVTNRLQDYAEKKLNRLNHYLPYIVDLRLELAQEHYKKGGDHSVAQLTIRDKHGAILRAEDKSQTEIMAAIDMVVDKMNRQISRYKGKHQRRNGERIETTDPELNGIETLPNETDEPAEPAEIVRRKRIQMAPMNEEEAIDQMELLGHDFFVFFNADSGTVNVLYRRDGGDYGLLEPDVI